MTKDFKNYKLLKYKRITYLDLIVTVSLSYV